MDTFYSDNLNLGQKYERFVTKKLLLILGWEITPFQTKWTQLRGENKEGIEIKFDQLIKKFNRVYIEVAEKLSRYKEEYTSSGIFRKDNTKLFIIGDYDKAYIFEIEDLRRLFEVKPKWLYHPPPSMTSVGFCIPIAYARRLAAYIVDFRANRARFLEPERRLRYVDTKR